MRFLHGSILVMSLVLFPLSACASDHQQRQWPELPLDPWLTSPVLWQSTARDFMDHYNRYGFGYESSGREEVSAVNPGLTFWTNRLYGVRVTFTSGTPTGMVKCAELLIYDRGDDTGRLVQAEFDSLLGKVNDALTRWAGSSGVSSPEMSERETRVKRSRAWTHQSCHAELGWAFSNLRSNATSAIEFRAEYIRLRISRGDGDTPTAVSDSSAMLSTPPTSITLKNRVKHEPGGDIWVSNLPMVDQGRKGYCAAASSERLLRYYGRNIDEHQVAQLADTARDKGTTFEGMTEALKTICHRYQLDFITLIPYDFKAISTLVKDYNLVAKEKIDMDLKKTFFLHELYDKLDAATFRKSRCMNTQGVNHFREIITQYTAAGVPLLWGVMVGIYPENPPLHASGTFGHIRIIVGLNTKTDEVLYTDSWGPGHELKRIPFEDAWAMTTIVQIVKPFDIR